MRTERWGHNDENIMIIPDESYKNTFHLASYPKIGS